MIRDLLIHCALSLLFIAMMIVAFALGWTVYLWLESRRRP